MKMFEFKCHENQSFVCSSCRFMSYHFCFFVNPLYVFKHMHGMNYVTRVDVELSQEEEAFEEISMCEVCKEAGDEAQLLLCDGMHGTCNATFHYTCVGLSAVPVTQ